MPTLSDVALYRYEVPLAGTLQLGPLTLSARQGLLLRVRSKNAEGWGEIAPLPTFSREEFTAAEAQARELVTWGDGRSIPPNAFAPNCDFASAIDGMELLPSVRCGLEGALAWLLAVETEKPLPEVLGPGNRTLVSLNGLLTASDDLATEAHRLLQAGYQVVKMKVGRRTVATDVVRVQQAREALGPNVALRLDANRAWSWREAATFAEALGELNTLDYIEEPLSDPSRLADFAQATGWPVALDETLVGLTVEEVQEHTYAAALVCKPMLLGGPIIVRRIADRAARWGGRTVISSALETGVGTRLLLGLAAALPTSEASGLDTYRRLPADVLRERLPFEAATVELQAPAYESPEVVEDHLTLLR